MGAYLRDVSLESSSDFAPVTSHDHLGRRKDSCGRLGLVDMQDYGCMMRAKKLTLVR